MTIKNYYRIMLGRRSIHADECYRGNFIGADFDLGIDLTGKLPENWRIFNLLNDAGVINWKTRLI